MNTTRHAQLLDLLWEHLIVSEPGMRMTGDGPVSQLALLKKLDAIQETPSDDPFTRAMEVMMAPPITWRDTASAMQSKQCDEVSKRLMGIAQMAVRCAAYFDERSLAGAADNHSRAVQRQNYVVSKFRRAMGMTYPKDDINF